MNLCVSSGTFGFAADRQGLPRELHPELIKAAGFDEVDFSFSSRILAAPGWEASCRERAAALREAGLVIRYAHLPFGYPAESDAEGWRVFYEGSCRAMELAVELGVECAAIHPRTSMREDYDHDAEHDKALEFMRPYCEYARKAGLTLALENMRGAGRSAPARIRRYAGDVNDLITLADELGVGICWDTGHGNISMQDQYKSVKKIGPRLRMLHINDNHAEDDVHILPFLGSVNWQGFAAAIAEIGFSGSLNMELSSARLPEAVRPHYVRAMAEADRALRGLIESCRAQGTAV